MTAVTTARSVPDRPAYGADLGQSFRRFGYLSGPERAGARLDRTTTTT